MIGCLQQSPSNLYAAPTLEGMKPSCLFSCRDSEVGNVEELVLAYNRCLNPKRIYLQIMKHSPDFKLILVYRKDLLDMHLCQEDIQQFLSAFGYGFVTTRQALYHLQEHMCKECFPHEIGVFLGYPLDDVVSFIQNNGKNYQEIGYWKIYHNLSRARKTTARFLQSMECTLEKLQEGIPLEQLITA